MSQNKPKNTSFSKKIFRRTKILATLRRTPAAKSSRAKKPPTSTCTLKFALYLPGFHIQYCFIPRGYMAHGVDWGHPLHSHHGLGPFGSRFGWLEGSIMSLKIIVLGIVWFDSQKACLKWPHLYHLILHTILGLKPAGGFFGQSSWPYMAQTGTGMFLQDSL